MVAVAIMAASLVQAVLSRAYQARLRITASQISPVSRNRMRRAIGWFVSAAVVLYSIPLLDLPRRAERGAVFLAQLVAIISAITFVAALWDAVCDAIATRANAFDQRAEKLLVPVTRKLVRAVIFTGGGLIVLAAFGVNVTGLLAGVGIGGLIVALAAKDSVENLFGSLTILFDTPFALGDWVKMDKIEGVVEEINLRSTRIRSFEDSILTVPNSNFIRATVENFGARRVRRQKFTVFLSYDSDAESIERFTGHLQQRLEGMDGVAAGRSIVRLTEMTETALGVLVQCFFEATTQADELRMRDSLMRTILRIRDESGVLFTAHPRPLEPAPAGASAPGLPPSPKA